MNIFFELIHNRRREERQEEIETEGEIVLFLIYLARESSHKWSWQPNETFYESFLFFTYTTCIAAFHVKHILIYSANIIFHKCVSPEKKKIPLSTTLILYFEVSSLVIRENDTRAIFGCNAEWLLNCSIT